MVADRLGRRALLVAASAGLARRASRVRLLVVTGGILWEAVWRLGHPAPVDSGIVIWVAAIGVLCVLAAGLTLLPALLTIGGRRAFWPRRDFTGPSSTPSTAASTWRRCRTFAA